MKIYSWNVNGIRAVEKKGLFKPFIEQHQPDILCLQETKVATTQIEDEFSALYPEYEQYWHEADRKGYSGTAIFSKIPVIQVLLGLPEDLKKRYQLEDAYGDTTKEGRITTIELENLYVSCVYTPNAKDDLSRIPMRQQWDPAYLEYMKRLAEDKPVVFCGDLNVAHTEQDLARPKANQGKKGFTAEERQGIDSMLGAGFIDSFRKFHSGDGHYTWWSHFAKARERNVGWRIDYVMADASLSPAIKRASIHAEVIGSDHCPVSMELLID